MSGFTYSFMKTFFDDEIELHKPRTDWVELLLALVSVIAVTFCAYIVLMLIAAIKVIN